MSTVKKMGNQVSKAPNRRQKQADDSFAGNSVCTGTGIRSSDLKILFGRAFNANNVANYKYLLPVDDMEVDRLTLQHYCLR